jgi:hypothetical protein
MMKTRPVWCTQERDCQYVYNVGEMCIGCMTTKESQRPWKNAYSLCFGPYQRPVLIRTIHLLGLFKCIKEAVGYERRNDHTTEDY